MISRCVNFVGNGLVIYIFLKTKSLRTPTNMFVVNLAISDCIMMCTMGLPVTINAFVQERRRREFIHCKSKAT